MTPYGGFDEQDDSLAIRSRNSKAKWFASVVMPICLACLSLVGAVVGTWQAIDRRLVSIEASMAEQTRRQQDFWSRDWSNLVRRLENIEQASIMNSNRMTKIETQVMLELDKHRR